jgi:hypothetical protein
MKLGRVTLVALLTAGVFATSAVALIGGTPDNGAHPYAGAAAQQGGNLCSGFLASPTVFVTAAHCFSDGAQVFVSNAPVFGSVPPTPGIVHNDPAYRVSGTPPNTDNVDDVAVVILSAPIAASRYGKLPLPFMTLLLPNGTPIDDVAYGVPTAGLKQVARQTIVRGRNVPSNDIEISAGVTCLGDSGGPNLLARTDIVLAINSYGPNEDCSGVSYSQRLDTLEVQLFLYRYLLFH